MTVIDNEEKNKEIKVENKAIPNSTGVDPLKSILTTGEKIEEKLNVMTMVSNPCLYKKRYRLFNEFRQRIESNYLDQVNLYVVELAYNDQPFVLTDKDNKNHLQLRTTHALWHKENCLNLGVKYLLPPDWKHVCFLDTDIEFENVNWATDALKLLNKYDAIQLFSHALDLDDNNMNMSIFSSFCYLHYKGYTYNANRGINYFHPGYNLGLTRETYEKMGGLFEYSILGSGDYIMCLALIGMVDRNFIKNSNPVLRDKALAMQEQLRGVKIAAVPGILRHYFHGSKVNRKYTERWHILDKYDYNPDLHIAKDDKGVLIPSVNMPQEFIADIYNYFVERNEDE